MYKLSIFTIFLVLPFFGQVGVGTTTPQGALDVSSTNDGVLVPRIALTSINAATPLTAPVESELVYNTSTAGTAPNNVTPGFYYWNGTLWSRLAVNNSTWGLNGNTGTNATTDFVGTTDTQDLVFKVSNQERMRINSTAGNTTGTVGDISIGDANSGTIKSTKELVLRQDGDVFGSSALRLLNRFAQNGVIYENLNPTVIGTHLVDFIFKTGTTASPLSSNFRFEARAGAIFGAGNTTEWQMGQPGGLNGGPTLIFGANGTTGSATSAFLLGNVGIGTATPVAKLHNTGTTAFTTATSGTNNTILLFDGGTFATPVAATSNSGLVYFIRNTNATTNVVVNSIIDFGSTTAANFSLTPALGSIMIVSNGVNWFRL